MFRVELPAEFRAYFEEGWRAAVPSPAPPTHVILPDHRASLTAVAGFPFGPDILMLAGPKRGARTVPVDIGGTYVGLAIRPGAAAALGLRPHTNYRPVALPAVAAGLARIALDLADRSLLFDALRELIRRAKPLDPLVADMVAAIERSRCSARLCLPATSLSERQRRRRFSAATGLSPKAFAATLRLRSAMIEGIIAPDTTLASVATGNGFADQPHLGRAIQAAFGAPAHKTRAALQQTRRRFLSQTSETF